MDRLVSLLDEKNVLNRRLDDLRFDYFSFKYLWLKKSYL